MELVVLLHLFHLFRTLSSPSLPHVRPLCFTILHHHHHLLLLVTFHPFTMETKSFVDGKRTFIEDDIDDEYLDDEEGGGEMISFAENEKKRAAGAPLTGKRGSIAGSGGGVSPPRCQAEKCAADLTDAKRYHRRHKVCEFHSKAAAVVVAGQRQRFCQQCSRFHELSEFDEAKRSCRRRLAGHNERRRKVGSAESSGEVSGRRGVRQADDQRGRIHVTIPGNSGYNKHLQIR